MNYDTFKAKMAAAGDAYVQYISPVSNKQKYHICTLELTDCKYIADKLANRPGMSVPKPGTIRAFCWDLDDFKNIEIAQVVSVIPLSTMVK